MKDLIIVLTVWSSCFASLATEVQSTKASRLLIEKDIRKATTKRKFIECGS